MLDIHQLPGLQERHSGEAGAMRSAIPHVNRRISFAIEIPIQRADLPALSLIGLAVTFIGWGIWLDNSFRFLSAPSPATTSDTPLLTSLLQTNGIPLTFALALALLILAAALALSPLRWWATIRYLFKTGLNTQWRRRHRAHKADDTEDAEAWVAAQAAWIAEYQAAANHAAAQQADQQAATVPTTADAENTDGTQDRPIDDTAGNQTTAAAATGDPAAQAPAGAEPASPAAATPETQSPEQNASAPAAAGKPGAQQPAANPQAPQDPAAAQQDAESTADPKAPRPNPATPRQQPSSDLAALAEETQEAALDLEELTDVEDILSSFVDNDTISPHLLTLSASVDDVDVATLAAHTHQVITQFSQPSHST